MIDDIILVETAGIPVSYIAQSQSVVSVEPTERGDALRVYQLDFIMLGQDERSFNLIKWWPGFEVVGTFVPLKHGIMNYTITNGPSHRVAEFEIFSLRLHLSSQTFLWSKAFGVKSWDVRRNARLKFDFEQGHYYYFALRIAYTNGLRSAFSVPIPVFFYPEQTLICTHSGEVFYTFSVKPEGRA